MADMTLRLGLLRTRGWAHAAVAVVLLGVSAEGFAQLAPGYQPVVETFGLADQTPPGTAKPPVQPPSAELGLFLGPVAAFALEPLSDAEMAAIEAEDEQQALVSKAMRYGVWRPIVIDPRVAGEWIEVVGSGSLWTTDVVVSDALGVRLQFVDVDLPAGAQLFVYSPDLPERVWGPYEGTGLFEYGEFWTPTTLGERVRVEYFIPQSDAGQLEPQAAAERWGEVMTAAPFTIYACQHVYRDAVLLDRQEREGTCHNDVTCYAAWANTAKASAGIGTIDQNALYCSGTMLTTTANDQTPYWLTANHCISSDSQAQGAEIYWLFQTSTCNGSPPSLASVPQSAVCTRLSSSSTSDYCLLMVEGTIPSGLYWSGWTSTAVADGTNVTCIHHPDGAYKRISFATKTAGAAANFIRAGWYDGPTEPGSSGSGLFRDDTKQLVGQLYGGPSACGNESYDDYGAFATSYSSISSYLAAGSDDAYEQNDSCAAARAMTAGTYSNLVVKRYSSGDEDWYKVTVSAGQTLTLSLSFTHNYGDIDLQLFAACGGAVIASSTGSGNSEQVTYTNNGGSAATYYARVYLANDTRSTYSMTISLSGGGGGPANNACTSAIAVTNGAYTGTTVGATVDGSASCGSSNSTPDVWYKYTAPAGGTLALNTCGSGYDTVLSVHSACPGTSSNQRACNDDCGGSPCGGTPSCLSTTVTSGTTYYIRVSGYNGATGSFTLNVSGPTANNDNCANAIVVTNGTYTGSTTGMTRDGSASCGSSSTTVDVWYSYTAPATGTLNLNSCGSGYDTVLSVHSGCPGTSSNQLACNDDCGGSPCGGVASCLSRAVTAGVTYRIRVSGYNGATGNFTLNVSGP